MTDRVVAKIWQERTGRKAARAFTSIGESWATYQRDVVPAAASQVQVDECKQAFYAGAAGCFTAVMQTVIGVEDDDASGQRLEALDRELEDFLVIFKKRHGI